MTKINITKFKLLMERWKDPTYLGDANKLNRLADETINLVSSEPLIKDICEMFMYAVSTKMVSDPNFQQFQTQLQSSRIQQQFQKIAK